MYLGYENEYGSSVKSSERGKNENGDKSSERMN